MPLIDLTEQESVRLCEGLARRPRGIMTPEDHALTNKLRNPQAKAWEPIALGKTIPCACKESVQGNCHVAIAPSNQYGERLEVIDGADVVSVILPDNIRLCRLVSQEA